MADLHSAPEDQADPAVRVVKGFLRGARPPADRVLIGTWTPVAFAELRTLRASVRQALAVRPLPTGAGNDDVARRLAIVATELAANAMAHTGPPTTVRLGRTATTYIVEVADNNPWLITEGTGQRFARAGGLGLHMARRLSLRMGWYTDAGTTYVWAEVAGGPVRRAPGSPAAGKPGSSCIRRLSSSAESPPTEPARRSSAQPVVLTGWVYRSHQR